jgi:7,8-dihydroneopterin aldolase/epimerase/oxygenase
MSDLIRIEELELRTHIGVPAEERAKEQRVLVSCSLILSTKEAAKTDDHHRSADYAALIEGIKKLAMTERKTIERLAEDIAALCLKERNIEAAEVTVQKFPFPDVKEVSVTIGRKR